jgi:hypothetical protein
MRIKIIITTFLIFTLLLFNPFVNTALSDLPPDPGTGGPGTGDIPVGGGSPLEGGLILLISLGVTYGFKKLYSGRKEKEL